MKKSHKQRIRRFSKQFGRNYKKSIRARAAGVHAVDAEIGRLKNDAVNVVLELCSTLELQRKYPRHYLDVKSAFSRAFQKSMPAYFFYKNGASKKEQFVSRCLAELTSEIRTLNEERGVRVREKPASIVNDFLHVMDFIENSISKLHKLQ